MTKGAKIWLWIAIALCVCTTVLNLFSGRIVSVIIAVVGIAGLLILALKEKKIGFLILCISYALAFANGVLEGINTPTVSLGISILMSAIGSLFVPCITYLFLRKSLKKMN